MSSRRLGWLAAVAMAALLEISCGQVYRPVVIPTTITPPNPSNFHAVFAFSSNVPFNLGSALQIDVSGDTNIGAANMGVNPTHATLVANNSRVFVASAGSLFQGDSDLITSFTPAASSSTATGLGAPTTFSLPSGSLPVFLHTTQNNAVYVANYGTGSVAALNASNNAVTVSSPTGTQPVALAETQDARHLYVVNQGSNTVTDVSPTDLSTLATIPIGGTPVWAVARPDNLRVYVVTQGDGKLYTIHTDTDTVIPAETLSVGGAGANLIVFDKSRSRLYVTNPTAGAIYIFDATTDPPTLLGTVTLAAPPVDNSSSVCGTYTCSYSPVVPVSVTPLPDGTRFYVASYVTGTATLGGSPDTCPDPNVLVPGCMIPQITVFDAASMTVKTTVFPLLPSATAAAPFAAAPATYCAPVVPYAPSSARFRMSSTAAVDSSRVYASVCDGGFVAIVTTTTSSISTGGTNTPDTLVRALNTPFSAGTVGTTGQPPLQNPILLLPGQ
jgi:YVTN family beta-propeller protein